jgi:cell division ATPase FtsA
MSEIDSMIKKIEYESLERARDRSKKQYGIIHDDIRLISSTITSITIDGKSVTNPLGFSGSQIRIRVLNVFSPSSEFNILRSIITSLGKRMISVVPTPLLFSKITERSEYVLENNLFLDIGYMHTTIVLESRNEIIAFETFPF